MADVAAAVARAVMAPLEAVAARAAVRLILLVDVEAAATVAAGETVEAGTVEATAEVVIVVDEAVVSAAEIEVDAGAADLQRKPFSKS